MTELIEKIAVTMHPAGDEACPFCPGKKEDDWKTTKGAGNSSTKLRAYMNNPKTNNYAQQSGARPKDGKEGRQSPDQEKPNPSPIFNSSQFGEYGDQAHHAISGNEIMKGHKIEDVITKGSDFKGDTGFTINNCANGVYLPAYPKSFKGIWGSPKYPKYYPSVDGSDPVKIDNVIDDQKFKLDVMKPAMNQSGQAHIGGHEGFYIEDLPGFERSYPAIVKDELDKIHLRVKQKGEECPFCSEGGKPKKPFVPPYKVNQWLDNLSADVARKLTSAPAMWPYFISQIAMDYFKDLKRKAPSSKLKLLD